LVAAMDSRDFPLDESMRMRLRLRCRDETLAVIFLAVSFVHGRLAYFILEKFEGLVGVISKHSRVMLPMLVGVDVVTTLASLINYL
jgi:hypothetical protein